MKIAVDIFPTDQTINPVEFATAAEELGFESHLVPRALPHPDEPPVTVGRRARARRHCPSSTNGPTTRSSRSAPCAAATSTVKLATGICLVAQRDPIHTAKEVASVDALSDGRMIFGIGYGWNKEEMAQHGTQYGRASSAASRADPRHEGAVDAGRGLVRRGPRADRAELGLAEAGAATAPADRPRRRRRPEAPRRTSPSSATGWMPIGSGQLKTGWEAVQRACDDIGRDPSSVELGVFNAPPVEAKLTELAQLGVTRAVLTMPQGPRDEVLAELERLAPLIDTMRDA